MDILFKDVSKSYHESDTAQTIFDRLSVQFPSRRVSVIVGKSGVGKSTLLNLAGGIDTPDAGEIRVGDSRITGMNDRDRTRFRRRHIGIIFQFFNLIPVLSVLDNICLVAQMDGRSRTDIQEEALGLLDQTGLYHKHKARPDTLSGGEQQRVAVVRALVNQPEVILADEPTGNLDVDTGRRILDLIVDLVRQREKTLVMVTHSPDAVQYADKVYAFEGRRLSPLSVAEATRS